MRKHFVIALFIVAVFGCLAMAIQQLANRIPYKWDLYMWSESPFLTNMLKIDAGQSIYTSPEQVNSFVYSPGLEYITYALLKPIGRQLDIRYCRFVSVSFAVLAALAFMRCAVLLGRESFPRIQSRWFPPLSAALFFLVIYHNFTSDVPHPDNLHIWHLAVTLMLTFEAIKRPSAWRMATAVLFASLAVLVKQTAAFSAIGVCIGLLAFAPRRLRTASWLIPLAAAASVAALAGLWSMGQGRLYTFDVLSSHWVQKEKISHLIYFVFKEYRLLPLTLYAIALYCGLKSQNRALRQLLLAHLMIGVFEGGPALLAFLKIMGDWNNLAVIEAWATVPFVPYLLTLLRNDVTEVDRDGGSASLGHFTRIATLALSFSLVYCLIPIKDSPLPSHYDYCRKIQDSVVADLKAGKRVLIAHGTSFLIRGKARQVPMDRANSFLELAAAGRSERTGTEQRIRAGYYDKIYLNSRPWYAPQIYTAIAENYREVARIPAPIDRNTTTVLGPDSIGYGFQILHVETPVFELRPPRESRAAPHRRVVAEDG